MSEKEEVANIEAHIKALLPESYLESIGANVQAPNHKRELHHRCMRIFDDLADRLAGADALRREVALRLVLKCAERACDADNMDAAVDYVREAIRQIAPTEPTR